METYKNIQDAHHKFKFPGSYRIGTIINNNIVIRIYSNSISANDYFSNYNKNFYYIIKSLKIYEAFKNSKNKKHYIHVFKKNLKKNNITHYGLFKVIGFRKNKKYVLLEKI